MNFCYIDESGTGNEPIATMVGIVVDSGRMHLTKSHWSELLEMLSSMTERHIVELHTANFYSGNGVWRGLDGPRRARITTAVLRWLHRRKHHVVYSSILKSAYEEARNKGQIPEGLDSIWRLLGFHLTLGIQKYSQREKNNKGHTVLVFDRKDREESRFIELLDAPPEWSDQYYSKERKQDQLDQILDVPYFVDSKYSPLIQVADFLAFFLRRYAELQEELTPPRYDDEKEKITQWANLLAERSIGSAHIYPKQRRNDAQNYFYTWAPSSIREL